MMDIALVQTNGKHFVVVTENDRELKRRGPFSSAVVARAMADQLCELLEIPKNDVDVDTANLPSLVSNHEFIVDCARFAEGLVSEAAVRKKYHLLGEEAWTALGNDDALCERVEEEKLRRIRNGNSKRERAQQLVVKAPNVLDAILMDNSASPKTPYRRSENIGRVCHSRTKSCTSRSRRKVHHHHKSWGRRENHFQQKHQAHPTRC
jgi:hypothetical protein